MNIVYGCVWYAILFSIWLVLANMSPMVLALVCLFVAYLLLDFVS